MDRRRGGGVQRAAWRRAAAHPLPGAQLLAPGRRTPINRRASPPACARIRSLKYQPGGQGGQRVLRAQGKLLTQPIGPGMRFARPPRALAALACQRRGALMRNVLCPQSLKSHRVHRCINVCLLARDCRARPLPMAMRYACAPHVPVDIDAPAP